MSLNAKAMAKVAKHKPQLMLIPIVPLGLTIASFIMSLLALRKASRLSLHIPG